MFRSRRGKPLKLQQRHFEFIAHTLKKYGASQSIIVNFANELIHTNPMFKSERFLRAAGYYDPEHAVVSWDREKKAERAKHTAAAIVAAGSKDMPEAFAEALAKMQDKVKAAETSLIDELTKAIAREEHIAEDEWTSDEAYEREEYYDPMEDDKFNEGLSSEVPF